MPNPTLSPPIGNPSPTSAPSAADRINERLRSGGVVQLTTYTRSTLYGRKHAGMFFMSRKNMLMVKSGRGSVCIEYTSIRLGWEV